MVKDILRFFVSSVLPIIGPARSCKPRTARVPFPVPRASARSAVPGRNRSPPAAALPEAENQGRPVFRSLSRERVHDPLSVAAAHAETEVKTTTCYMCACRCGIRVHLRASDEGPQLRYIDGNPRHPLNQGVICAKGASGIMKQFSPARITQPLLRKAGS